ncbi:GNAT family N-acetyltransferase [Bradymonas sediminis]|nr:GNAT family N-acetyltransferase [Bradymonas sediminis]TDP75784.1 hypothetical protein DFR33_103123 [Bradymonas sediminis]
MGRVEFEIIEGIKEIDAAAWDQLVGADSPFLEYGFLRALEDSGCVGSDSGWHPQFLVARDSDAPDRLVGAMPLYLKLHSMGEFVFDWSWADAAQRAGIRYYPKAVVAVPMTPIQGRRILVDAALAPDDALAIKKTLVETAIDFAQKVGLSSVHFNFIMPDEVAIFEALDLPIRVGMQFHWHNHNGAEDAQKYSDFDAFLGRFRSKKRANIRRERRKLTNAGVRTRVVAGAAVTPAHLDRVFDYYRDTIDKLEWGRQYLNREFFQHLGEQLPQRLHLVMAEQDGEEFGGAFNLYKNAGLYGRYWGCTKEVEFAHFETCLYRPLDWCIEHGVEVFQPGAQGPHKYDRGFDPTPTYSAHWIRDPRLADAVGQFIAHERAEMRAHIKELRQDSPINR